MRRSISVLGLQLPLDEAPRPHPDDEPHDLDARGNVTQLPEGVRFGYDAHDRVTRVVHPDGTWTAFAYDEDGRLACRRSSGGHEVEYRRDGDALSVVADGEAVARCEATPTGLRLGASDAVLEVDPLESRQTVDGLTLTTAWAYGDGGEVESVLLPGSTQRLCFHRDSANGEVEIRSQAGVRYASAADRDLRAGNGVCDRWEVDELGRPTRFRSTAGLDVAYAFDDSTRIARLGGLDVEYDAEGRVARLGGTAFRHDARGNRVERRDDSGTTRFAYDACDRVVALERPDGTRVAYGYDADGRRTSRDEPCDRTEYAYDALGRLVEVRRNGAVLARHAYDALGRRVRTEANGETTVLHRDPLGNLVAETDAAGRARSTYLWAGGRCVGRIAGPVGEPVAEWYHLDHVGSALAVTGPAGETLWRRGGDPLAAGGPGPYMRKLPDAATGLYDFGSRWWDPETGCFLTPDEHSFAPDDARLLADPGLDLWGGRSAQRELVREWLRDERAQNRYAFCLGDPLNNLDLDGHSAWWFFLTIPLSLTWALPNTMLALCLVVLNLVMELVGWVFWFFISWKKGFHETSYPWGMSRQGGSDPPNPFDVNDRSHFWLGLGGSARLGVPWFLKNGSFFVWRPFTLGNVIFTEDLTTAADEAEPNSRFIPPNDPDTQLNREDALFAHEGQHVFQYAFAGPLFHSLPLPLLRHAGIDWFDKVNLGGLTWLVGNFFSFLTGFKLKPDDFAKALNPATLWSSLLPADWVRVASSAIDMNQWTPAVGLYEWDSKWFFDQDASRFERNAGKNSGDVYRTVVEAEETSLYAGEFTRVVGSDKPFKAVPANPTPRSGVTFAATPAASTSVLPITFFAPPSTAVAVAADGVYFQASSPGTYAVAGTGNLSNHTETEKIEVKDVGDGLPAEVFICSEHTIAVTTSSSASYEARLRTNNSGGSLSGARNMTYKAGQAAGQDTIDIVAKVPSAAFGKYGDPRPVPAGKASAADTEYVVKTLTVNVKLPTIKPATNEVFVGGIVDFTWDTDPKGGVSTTNVPGSQFDRAGKRFVAGKGPIAANTVETVTIDFGCRQFPFPITVKPIVATIAPASVVQGHEAQVNVAGGTRPYEYEVSVRRSTGPTVDGNGKYKAGTTAGQVVDTITVTDRNGSGGRARVDVTVKPS